MSTWILLIGTSEARLVEVTGVGGDRRHAADHERLVFRGGDEDIDPQHLAPRLSRVGGAAMDRNGHDRERRRTYVRQLVRWVPELLHRHAIEHAEVFCVPQVIGLLRRHLDDDTAGRLRWQARDLMPFRHEDLIEYAEMAEALESSHPD